MVLKNAKIDPAFENGSHLQWTLQLENRAKG